MSIEQLMEAVKVLQTQVDILEKKVDKLQGKKGAAKEVDKNAE